MRNLDLFGTAAVTSVLTAALGVETTRPLRQRRGSRAVRWRRNAAFGAVAAVAVRAVIVPAMEACARWAARRNVGLLRWVPLPPGIRVAASVLALDYTMYLWHRALHDVGVLWRFHSVHHADIDLDASTALRFHVGELAASLPFRCAQVTLLGVDRRVALAYEIALQCAASFHHSNSRLPDAWRRLLDLVIVTPWSHGIHHSVESRELGSNWSVVFSFWDRLHGTRVDRATQPIIGLACENDPRVDAHATCARPRMSR